MTYENNQVFNSYVKQSNVTNLQTINIGLTTGRNYTNTQIFHGHVNNTSVTNHQIIDNKSSQSIHCSMYTQQTPSPPLAHHVLKPQNNFINKPEVIDLSKMTTIPSLNDAVLDLSMKNKHKLDDNAELINCLSNENYEMPTSDDEDLEIIGFDPAGTNDITSEHPDSTNTTTTTTNSSNQRNIPKIGRGRPFPRYLFHDLEPEVLTPIPTDIDGMKYYKVKTNIKTWCKNTSDLHYFILKTTSKEGVYGNTIKTGSCHGSWICPNKSCPFVGTSHEHQPNKVNWRGDPICKGVQICKICDTYAVREGCGARKLVTFDPKSQVAIVYHLWKHTCWNKNDTEDAKAFLREKAWSGMRTGSAKEVAIEDLCDKIIAGDIEVAENDAEKWTNYRLTKWILNEADPSFGEDHNSFDAVAIAKKGVDKKSPYYIYKVNNGASNNTADYVFKISPVMAQIAIDMNIDGPQNILQKENTYFDTTFCRVYGFSSFGLWFYHPSMHKILHPATMDMRTENSNDIAISSTYSMRFCQRLKARKTTNSTQEHLLCDEGGANYKAITMVYGNDFCKKKRVFGCQFHFLNDMHKKNMKWKKISGKSLHNYVRNCAMKLQLLADTMFINQDWMRLGNCIQLLAGSSIGGMTEEVTYFLLSMGGMITRCEYLWAGKCWLETISHNALGKGCQIWCATMLLKEKELFKFNWNLGTSSGKGPSQAVRDAKDRKKQLQEAEDFVNILDDEEAILLEAQQVNNPTTFIPKAVEKHRAKEDWD